MSVANSNQWSSNGIQYLFWAVLSGSVPMGTTGAIANGASAGMGRLRGVKTMEVSEPDASRVYQTGDNGVITAFLNQPQELPGGTMTTGVYDQTFAAKANGQKVVTLDDWDMSGGFPLCFTNSDIIMVANSPMNSQESTSLDEAGWDVCIILKTQIQSKTVGSKQSATPADSTNVMNCKRSGTLPWGTTFSTATHGSTAYSFWNFASPYPVKLHTFVGNAAATTFTLDETPVAASATAVKLFAAATGVQAAYTTDYTLVTSTKVVTFASAPGTGVTYVTPYEFVPGC